MLWDKAKQNQFTGRYIGSLQIRVARNVRGCPFRRPLDVPSFRPYLAIKESKSKLRWRETL